MTSEQIFLHLQYPINILSLKGLKSRTSNKKLIFSAVWLIYDYWGIYLSLVFINYIRYIGFNDFCLVLLSSSFSSVSLYSTSMFHSEYGIIILMFSFLVFHHRAHSSNDEISLLSLIKCHCYWHRLIELMLIFQGFPIYVKFSAGAFLILQKKYAHFWASVIYWTDINMIFYIFILTVGHSMILYFGNLFFKFMDMYILCDTAL